MAKTKRIGIIRISTKLLGILLRLPKGHRIVDVLGSDQRNWHPYEFEIIVEGPYGLQVIPGASGLPDLADLPEAQREVLLRALLVLDGRVDLLLIDTSAGVGASVVQFILAAGELLLVTTPEPTAITDAYALVKILAGYQPPVSIKLVVNNVQRRGEGEATGYKLAAVAEQFLGRRIEIVGELPHDRNVMAAVSSQCPLLQGYPRSPAAVAIEALGEQLWNGEVLTRPKTSLSRFFRNLLAFSPVNTPL